MNEEAAALLTQVQTYLWTIFPIFLRVGGAMALMPGFGEQSIPARVRLFLTFAFTMIVFGGLPISDLATDPGFRLAYFGEALVGLLIGAMLRLFVLSLQTAGMMIAQSISLSQLFGGTEGQAQPAIGQMLLLGGLALATHFGLHVKIAALLISSYDVVPLGQLPDPEVVRAWGVAGVSHTFALSFSIAMPFVLGGLIYNVALGAINRAMPQLMVSFVGAPALTLGGLIFLALAAPSGLAIWLDAFDAFLRDPFRILP